MSETKRRGYRSVSVRAPVFDRLLDIAQREGLNSAAEAVEYLTAMYYERASQAAGLEEVVANLLFDGKKPGSIVEVIYQGRGRSPLVYLTYRVETTNGRPRIRLVVAVNPVPIVETYCPRDSPQCLVGNLLPELRQALDRAADVIMIRLRKHSQAVEILENLGVSLGIGTEVFKDKCWVENNGWKNFEKKIGWEECRGKLREVKPYSIEILKPLEEVEHERKLLEKR